MKLTRAEQETIIKGNAEDKEWEIITADVRIKSMMRKRGWEAESRVNPWGYESYKVPYDDLVIRSKFRKGRKGVKISQASLDALQKGRLARSQ